MIAVFSIYQKYVVKVRPFATAKIYDMYDHMKPTQRNFLPNLCTLNVGANEAPTDMTPDNIYIKIIELIKHLKSKTNQVAISSITLLGDSYKEKAEAVIKLVK